DSVAIDFSDGGRLSWVGAVRIVVPRSHKARRGHHRRIKVAGRTGHVRVLIAELAVERVEQGIGDGRAIGAGNRSRVVHALDHHGGRVTRRVGRVHFPARIGQTVEGSPRVGIDAGNFVSLPITGGNWHIRR